MNIPNKESFEPSGETLKKWLKTKKKEYFSVEGERFKPLLSDVGNKEAEFWFILAITIELLALGSTIYGGMRSGGVHALIAIALVFAFIVLDFVFAKLLHKKVGDIIYKEAESECNGYFDESTYGNLENQISNLKKSIKPLHYFYVFMLFVMAILKVGAILILGTFNSPIIYFVFLALYMVVVYVHIKHTGYYISYKGFINGGVIKSVRQEYNIHTATEGRKAGSSNFRINKDKRKSLFGTLTKLKLPIEFKSHRIEIADKENNETDNLEGNEIFFYNIIAHGVFTDQEIVDMTAGQTTENSIKIFLAGRKLQLTFYDLGSID